MATPPSDPRPQQSAPLSTTALASSPKGKPAPPTIEEVRVIALKLLYNVGNNGMLQKNLFSRLPRVRMAQKINVLASLADAGLAAKTQSGRNTMRWGYLWTITPAGQAAYVRELARSTGGVAVTR